ncbi:MAG: nucleoside phosphorylase [Cyclobacteriaceae bacterium]
MPKFSETDLIINPDGSIYHLNLKADQLSEKIITVGDPSRVHRVSRHFESIDFEMNKREFITHTGTYKGKRLTVISTGMGTDNVEILMNELDAVFNIDLDSREAYKTPKKLKLVRVGTSASIQESIPVGSHLMSEYGIGLDPMAHFYQMEMSTKESEISSKLQTAIGLPYSPYCVKGSDELLEKFKKDTILGNTVTCHGFYAPQGREIRVPIKYPKLVQDLNYFHVDDFWLTNLEMETAGYYALARILGHEMISLNAIIANRITNEFSKDPNQVIDDLILKVLETI